MGAQQLGRHHRGLIGRVSAKIQEVRLENLPNNMTVNYYDDYMHIQKTWYSIGTIFLTVFMVAWVGGTLFVFSSLWEELGESSITIALLMPLAFGVATICMIYACLAMWLNKTDIFVSQKLMEVRMGPVPWWGQFKRQTSDIVQFYVKKIITKNKNSTTITYNVMFKSEDGTVKKLTGGLDSYEKAHFIEQKVEHYLGIENVRTDGETNG